MVKKGCHKVFSVLMAFLVLFSTISFTIEKHFCGDKLIDVAVFSELQKCRMESYETGEVTILKKDCCKDELEIVKGQDKLKITKFEDLHLDQQQFLATLVYSYSNLFKGLQAQNIPHKDYSPPNLVVDIQILDQVFII